MLKDLENMFLKYTNMGEKLQKKKYCANLVM